MCCWLLRRLLREDRLGLGVWAANSCPKRVAMDGASGKVPRLGGPSVRFYSTLGRITLLPILEIEKPNDLRPLQNHP
jgi:hypothetical protein